MRNVYFEAFPNAHTEQELVRNQAADMRNLVRDNKNWLRSGNYSGAEARYNRVPLGRVASQMVRVGSSDVVRASIVREDLNAIGLRTLIMNQIVEHPDLGIVRGTEVDYWLDGQYDEDEELHDVVASMTVSGAADLRPGHNTFATLYPDDRPHQPRGLSTVLTPYGDPVQLHAPADDPFGIVKKGKSQLYAVHPPIPLPSIDT